MAIIDDIAYVLICSWPIMFIITGAALLGELTERWEPAGRALDWLMEKMQLNVYDDYDDYDEYDDYDDADDWDDWED